MTPPSSSSNMCGFMFGLFLDFVFWGFWCEPCVSDKIRFPFTSFQFRLLLGSCAWVTLNNGVVCVKLIENVRYVTTVCGFINSILKQWLHGWTSDGGQRLWQKETQLTMELDHWIFFADKYGNFPTPSDAATWHAFVFCHGTCNPKCHSTQCCARWHVFHVC